jgi:hypothetical protein
MTVKSLINERYSRTGALLSSRIEGTYLHDTLATDEGRRTMLYILTRLGLFASIEDEKARTRHNAAVDILNHITEQTGFALDFNLIR